VPAPAFPPAQPAPHACAESPPPAPCRSTRQQLEPRPFWISGAPLIPIHHDAPGPSPSPELAHLDQEPYQEESDDEQAAEIAHHVWGSVPEAVGIHPDFVEMEIDDVRELAFSAAQQAFAASNEPAMPKTFKQAMASPQKAEWEEACQQEIAAHMDNGTWRLVKLPAGRTPVGSRWVFYIKRTADGCIERYKARLVAQGFSQRPGWDFVESFAPTIRLSVVCALFALVAADDLECDSMDITTAFLNGDLVEEIYMKPPEGHEQYSHDGQLLYCLLLKALYGLKQGGRQWYLKLSVVMKEIGFRKVRSEPCVYVWEDSTGGKVVVPTYVDDCHIIGKTRVCSTSKRSCRRLQVIKLTRR
jgi:hypothetical protein